MILSLLLLLLLSLLLFFPPHLLPPLPFKNISPLDVSGELAVGNCLTDLFWCFNIYWIYITAKQSVSGV